MNTKIWAHRGASGYAPENTLESFELAIEQKADGIELDVQMTKDGELVVIHDETIDRTGNGTGRVQDHTLKELKALNFNKTHPEYASAKIPTLREVYELVKPSGITVNVEMKTGVYFSGICIVLELAEEMGMKEPSGIPHLIQPFYACGAEKTGSGRENGDSLCGWLAECAGICVTHSGGGTASGLLQSAVYGIPRRSKTERTEAACLDRQRQ